MFVVSGLSNDFFRSYLSNRSQFISLCNTKSHEEEIIYVVLQGSVVGPVVFNLYLNNVVNVSNKFNYVFADDIKILFSYKTTNNVENIVNIE